MERKKKDSKYSLLAKYQVTVYTILSRNFFDKFQNQLMKLQLDLKISDSSSVQLFYNLPTDGNDDKAKCDKAKNEVLSNKNHFLFSMPVSKENDSKNILPEINAINISIKDLTAFLGDSIDFVLKNTDTVNLMKLSLDTNGAIKFYFEDMNLPDMPIFPAGKLGFFISLQSEKLKAVFSEALSIECVPEGEKKQQTFKYKRP